MSTEAVMEALSLVHIKYTYIKGNNSVLGLY